MYSSKERIESGATLDKFRDFLTSIQTTDNELFICLYNDKVVGMSGLHCEKAERFKHRISMGINVLRDYWGVGVGSLLMETAIECFNSKDHKK